ncbi:type III restriction endonuclease EcoP15I subunit M [Thiomicrospira aerophila AL3]|uniref:site-specific DNA-methyltransferase (adenine-specific) n=1 Tax=Thiomicrospira aerophila AL3 TaxID=717772 RepID=W0DVU5_9GAMM|nr:site-specific DNA-methyltransferase [Thiomicrospira aerophila]AHF01408.1 type III restriction endonuclease EcoP15I subunit M [Thiomicrospira aerophila AL3]
MNQIKPEILADNSETTINSQQVATLKKHFPQCFDKEGNFIAEKLNEIISSSGTAFSKESYGLSWLGKSYARLLANENPLTLLAEDKEHNQKPENQDSENLLIKGDNLEVLKHLKGAYSECIKMIYIDPPYNTGSDGFVYQDDRKFTPDQLAELAGIEQNEAKRILEFTQSKANSHSAWLTFMYPRLYIARELLKDDGVIFISIDNNEQAQLRVICDEVFGEANYLGLICWKNVTDNNPTNIATEHEYIVVYAKSKDSVKPVWKSFLSDVKDLLIQIGDEFNKKYKDQDKLQKAYTKWFRENKFQLGELDRYKYIDEEGVYTGSQSVHNPGKDGYRYDVIHPDTGKPCKEPLMGYRFPESTMKELLDNDRVLFGKDHNKIIELKVYAKDFKDKLSSIFVLDGRVGATELRDLFPDVKTIFTNPKPVELLKRLISFATDHGDIVLDFFGGSGTTAHSNLALNSEDNGSRKFIIIQIDEKTDSKKDAHKAGFNTIFEITKARIKKAAEKIRAENPDYNGDLGFQIFETLPVFEGYLDNIETLEGEQGELFDGSALSDDQLEHLLSTWKVYDGIPLTQRLIETDLAGYIAYRHDRVLYLMHQGFRTESLKAFLSRLDETDGDDKNFDVEKVVLFGYNFDSKNQLEINEAVRQYQNRKEKTVSVLVRY